jgi:hypothetical protein
MRFAPTILRYIMSVFSQWIQFRQPLIYEPELRPNRIIPYLNVEEQAPMFQTSQREGFSDTLIRYLRAMDTARMSGNSVQLHRSWLAGLNAARYLNYIRLVNGDEGTTVVSVNDASTQMPRDAEVQTDPPQGPHVDLPNPDLGIFPFANQRLFDDIEGYKQHPRVRLYFT